MRKVVVVNTVGIGREGISSVIYNYCFNMNRENLEFTFVSPSGIKDEVRVKYEVMGRVCAMSDRKKKTFSYLRELWSELQKNKYDVIHVHGNSGTMILEVMLAKLCGIKKIIIHSHNKKCSHPIINSILKKPMINMADYLLACSDEAGKFLYGKHRYIVLPNAIDIEKFSYNENTRCEVREELGIRGEFVIGHIGNFVEQKNHSFLIEIYKKFHQIEPNSKLLLVSDGPLFEKIKKTVEEYGLMKDVIFAGRRSDVERLYQAMDIFVFPSLWEGFGMVLIEAQASGLYCIVSDEVPRKTKALEETSYLSLNDKNIWIEKILSEKIEKKERRTISNEAVDYLKCSFDIKSEADILKNIYFSNK